jgi:hypothetical protein
MKALTFAVALLAFVGLVLVGCTDNAQSPVAPAEQAVQAPGSLAKLISRSFTFTMVPTGITDPGTSEMRDGILVIRGIRGPTSFTAAFADGNPDLLTGPGEVEINARVDLTAGVGKWFGRLTLKPVAPQAAGGVWEFVWVGTGTLGASGWTLPLKEIGYGVGGALTGKLCNLQNTITAPADMSTWASGGRGLVVSR